MQAKRQRISMADLSAEPRPEERRAQRRVSKDAQASANGGPTRSCPSTSSGPAFETPLFRAAPQNEGYGRVSSTSFGRGRVRALLLSGLGAAAIACGASLAFADTALAPAVPILSPEAPPSFGDGAAASPLVAVYTAARGARDPAPDIALSAEPKFDLASSARMEARGARGDPGPLRRISGSLRFRSR